MMTRLPPETLRGHEEPFVRQFSIFLPNRVGQLREFIRLFVKQGVHIVALDVVDSVDWAVVRTIFSDANKARELLGKAKLAFTECPMLAVELPSLDALADVAAALLSAELNLRVAYPLLITAHGRPVVAFNVDDTVTGIEVLRRHGFTLLDDAGIWPQQP